LARKDDIHSTERLLNLIRSDSASDRASSSETSPDKPSRPKLSNLISPVSFRKRITVGVDIGHTYIKLAKISQSDKLFEILDILHIPLNKQINVNDPTFTRLLKSTLDDFCGAHGNPVIWSAIQSARVETRCIRIPKVPRKQIANAIYWTFTKKIEFDKNEELLDFEILGDITEDGVKKTEVMAYKAPKQEIADIRDAFHSIGYPLKGITIVPFAIQNLFRSRIITTSEEDACCLFIGRDWSRIAIFNKNNLVLSRGIKAGMHSMVEAINIAIKSHDGWDNRSLATDLDENQDRDESTDSIDPAAQKTFFEFVGVSGVKTAQSDSSDTPDDIHMHKDATQVFQMILPAMERLVRQVERTFEHYALNFNSEGVRRIFISGMVTANPKILNYIGKQLDMPIAAMNPFPADSAFVRRIRIPENVQDREGYVPAIGLALASNNITPNFLYTHEDRDQNEAVRRNNMRILTACMIILMVLIGIFSWQENKLDAKRDRIDELNNRLLTYNPPAEKDLLLALYAKTKSKRETINQIVHRYTPAAIVAELSDITPANIRLMSIDATFNSEQSPSGAARTVTINGIIFGDPDRFEPALTGYLLDLRKSPIFRKPNVRSKQVEYYQNQQVLRFSASLDVI
jgi:Tfp pilus assembly PilM family ATPase